MASIPEFLAVTTVAAGSGTAHDAALAIGALDDFVASFPQSDERNVLTVASQAFEKLCLNGSVAEAIRAHINARLSGRASESFGVAEGEHAL